MWMNWVEHCFKWEHYCLIWDKMVQFRSRTFTQQQTWRLVSIQLQNHFCVSILHKNWKNTIFFQTKCIDLKHYHPFAKQFINMFATNPTSLLDMGSRFCNMTQIGATKWHNQNETYIFKFAATVYIRPQAPATPVGSHKVDLETSRTQQFRHHQNMTAAFYPWQSLAHACTHTFFFGGGGYFLIHRVFTFSPTPRSSMPHFLKYSLGCWQTKPSGNNAPAQIPAVFRTVLSWMSMSQLSILTTMNHDHCFPVWH